MKCISCFAPNLFFIEGFLRLKKITSDSKPFDSKSELFYCLKCGLVQKKINFNLLEEINLIYENYDSYFQSGGAEQKILDFDTGMLVTRSSLLLNKLVKYSCFNFKISNWLDYGCGNGSLLSELKEKFNFFELFGVEINENSLSFLSKNTNFSISKSINFFENTFDVVSAIHVLEHMTDPRDWLCNVRNKLNIDGQILIQVCDLESNPFDILVADHITHFSLSSLNELLLQSGYEVVFSSQSLIPKELTFVAKKRKNFSSSYSVAVSSAVSDNFILKIDSYISFLLQMQFKYSQISKSLIYKSLGVWGTSNAAAWLTSSVDGLVSFYVDEDLTRVGRIFMGKPVFHPDSLNENHVVFLALPDILTSKIYDKYKNSNFQIEYV